MKFKITLIILFGFIGISSVMGQKKVTVINSEKLMEKGYKYFHDEKYYEALTEFQKVPEQDTNYYNSLIEQVLCYYELEKYDDGIRLAKKATTMDLYLGPEAYQNMGICYDQLEKYDESVKVYDEAEKIFPKMNVLYYNQGYSYEKSKKYSDAFRCYRKSLELNPFHPRSHYILGLLALNEGNSSLAMLAFTTYILMDPKNQISNTALSLVNEIATTKYQEDIEKKNFDVTDGDDFSEIDLLLENYAGLNKKYKVPTRYKLNLFKQLYLLLDKIPANPSHKGFWYNMYVPFYKQVLKENKFDMLALYLLQASASDEHKAIVSKNAVKINEIGSWIVTAWANQHRDYEIEFNGKVQQVKIFRANNRFAISSIEHFETESQEEYGYVEAFHENGRLKTKGFITKSGKKDGEWIFYYPNGNISEKSNFDKGKILYYEKYSLPGIIQYHIPYKDGKVDGQVIIYTKTGAKQKTMMYKEDKRNGVCEEFFSNGQLNKSYNYKDGEMDGPCKTYYVTGELYKEEFYIDGKQEKDEIKYFRNGKIQSKCTYVKNQVQGIYLEYYDNGVISDSVNVINGKAVGKNIANYPNGKLKSVTFLDESGKSNGTRTEYDSDGKLYSETEYKKGEVIGYKFYNKKGQLIKEDKKNSGSFAFQNFYPNGIKKSEGKYNTDQWQGEWKIYDNNGHLERITSYDDGKVIGTSQSFFSNGKLKSSTEYDKDVANGYYFKNYFDGTMEEQGNYKEGAQVGEWFTYAPNKNTQNAYFNYNDELNGIYKIYDIVGKISESHDYYMGVIRASYNYDTSGNVIDTIKYSNASGKRIYHYYAGGPVRLELNLVHGKYEGAYISYFPNGQIKETGDYVNGETNGLWSFYYPNGQLRVKGSYFVGDAEGKWEYFSEDGKLTSEVNYKNGLKDGKTIDYFDNGKIKREVYYETGELEGTALYYAYEGQLEHKRTYLHSQLTSYTYFDITGKEKTVDVENETADVKMYFPSGKPARSYSVKEGIFSGPYLIYYASGEIREQSEYVDSELHGLSISYYPNKQIHTKNNFYYGLLNGESLEYYSNGNLKMSTPYMYDQRHGKCYIYDANKKLKAIYTYYDDSLIDIKTF